MVLIALLRSHTGKAAIAVDLLFTGISFRIAKLSVFDYQNDDRRTQIRRFQLPLYRFCQSKTNCFWQTKTKNCWKFCVHDCRLSTVDLNPLKIILGNHFCHAFTVRCTHKILDLNRNHIVSMHNIDTKCGSMVKDELYRPVLFVNNKIQWL